MLFTVLAPDVKATALAGGQADLKFILFDNDIGDVAQAIIFNAGFARVKTFLGIGESREEVRTALKTEFGWDREEESPSAGLKGLSRTR
eukprot:7505475-Karenia_brevis.AAC.1